MTQHPQDRTRPVSKLAQTFGDKLENLYFFANGGDYDGLIIWSFPDGASSRALELLAGASGATSVNRTSLLMTAAEFKAVMEKAAGAKSVYTPPTETKQ